MKIRHQKKKINDYRIIADRSRKHGHGLYLRIKMVKSHLLKNICLNQTVSTYKNSARISNISGISSAF